MLTQRIGLIGTGQMATALGQGFVTAGLVPAENLLGSDPSAEARGRFTKATSAQTVTDNDTLVEQSDVILLAVKPHLLEPVCTALRDKIGAGKLVVSVAAGIRLDAIAAWLGEEVRLVRVMPNTPCLVGHGACGFCLGDKATDDDAKIVEQLLGAVGLAYQVEERLLDAVTGLSGSGPAFVYIIIEALSDAGVKMGLPRDIATALAAQTVGGAAKMVTVTGEHPAQLKDKVASPGGTTIAGIAALEAGGLRAALIGAVETATRRAIELGTPS